ncbi:hypothetical protein ACSBR2_042646 [Camellia fascicularis]
MPFETMGQRGLSASSCFREEICFSSEKELGFWKPKTMHYYQALRRHPVNCILQAHINHGSLLLGIWQVDALTVQPLFGSLDCNQSKMLLPVLVM